MPISEEEVSQMLKKTSMITSIAKKNNVNLNKSEIGEEEINLICEFIS